MKRIYILSVFISLLIIGCTPVAEKQKVGPKPAEEIPQKPEKIIVKPIEEVQILRQGPARISTKPYIPGTFLLETSWNQGFPYNKQLPKLKQKRVVSGCVNTALAQVLYYYRYPLSARGIVGYQWNNRRLTANLYKNYNWDVIPAKVTARTPDFQIDELAALFRDLGIVNGTTFNLGAGGGSGASFNTKAMAENFGFSRHIKTLKNDQRGFLQTIKKEIDRRRVVLLSISGKPSGHMTVIDGYRRDANGIKFHINMGWGGTDNDYYDLSKRVSPKSKKEKNSLASDYTFSREMSIYYNLVPCQGSDCYQNLEAEDKIQGMKIRGKFNSKKDNDVYSDLFLNGPTTFRGDRGYGNQAFYVKVVDDENRLLAVEAPKSKAFRINLSPGKYSVAVSLCNAKKSGGTCYGNKPKYLNYKVTIETKPVPLAEKNRIRAKDASPAISGRFVDMILKKEFETHKIRIDASDPDGDQLIIKAFTNPYDANVNLALKGNILSVTPNDPASNTTSEITVQAISKGKIAAKSFRILFSASSVAFGKEFDVAGKFTGQDSHNKHKVILQGNCSIQGDNGYKNQAFYTNVTDSEGRRLNKKPMDRVIRGQFPRGVYYIESKLKVVNVKKTNNGTSTSTVSYKYRKGRGDTYNINVSCPGFNDSIALLEKDNLDVPPRIITNLPDLILGVNFTPLLIPIETLDANGDRVNLSVKSNAKGVKVAIQGNRLSLRPQSPKLGTRLKTTVTASANGQQTKKSFTIFLQEKNISFGKKFEVNGLIKGQKDTQSHPVILSGQCRIIGDNGYRNQAFYTSVKHKDQSTYITATNKGIVRSFPKGIYYLIASLNNEEGRYYTYKRNKGDKYKLDVECSNMNETTDDIGRLLGL